MFNEDFFRRSLIRLQRKLRKTFPKDGYDDTLIVQDRYVDALDHVTEFFNRVGMDEQISEKFAELAHAIWGLRKSRAWDRASSKQARRHRPRGPPTWMR